MLSRGCGESFIGSLQNSLRANIDPASGGHLAVHHQAGAVEFVEMFPIAPVPDEIGIGDQHARRVACVRKIPTGLPDCTSSVSSFSSERSEATMAWKQFQLRAAFPRPAVDDQVLGLLGDFGIEIVHQHAQRGFLLPAFAGKRGAARRAHRLIAGCVVRWLASTW